MTVSSQPTWGCRTQRPSGYRKTATKAKRATPWNTPGHVAFRQHQHRLNRIRAPRNVVNTDCIEAGSYPFHSRNIHRHRRPHNRDMNTADDNRPPALVLFLSKDHPRSSLLPLLLLLWSLQNRLARWYIPRPGGFPWPPRNNQGTSWDIEYRSSQKLPRLI